MSEELGVDGAFRNRTAVDGEIFLASARGIVVNHAGDDLLTFKHMVQCLAVAHDIVPLFDGL